MSVFWATALLVTTLTPMCFFRRNNLNIFDLPPNLWKPWEILLCLYSLWIPNVCLLWRPKRVPHRYHYQLSECCLGMKLNEYCFGHSVMWFFSPPENKCKQSADFEKVNNQLALKCKQSADLENNCQNVCLGIKLNKYCFGHSVVWFSSPHEIKCK